MTPAIPFARFTNSLSFVMPNEVSEVRHPGPHRSPHASGGSCQHEELPKI